MWKSQYFSLTFALPDPGNVCISLFGGCIKASLLRTHVGLLEGDHDLLRSGIIAIEKTKHKLIALNDINFVSEGSGHSFLWCDSFRDNMLPMYHWPFHWNWESVCKYMKNHVNVLMFLCSRKNQKKWWVH